MRGFRVEVKFCRCVDAFEKAMSGVAFAEIGRTNDTDTLTVKGLNGGSVVSEKLEDLKAAWKEPLAW